MSTADLHCLARCVPVIVPDCASLCWINFLPLQVGIQSPAFRFGVAVQDGKVLRDV